MTDTLTVPQVAALTGCHRVTVAQACQRGALVAEKVGRDWHITPEALEEAIAAGVLRPRPRKGTK